MLPDIRDQMASPFYDNGSPVVINKGYTKQEVEKIAKEAADKTAASWKELSDLNWINAKASRDTLDAIIADRLEPNKKAIRQYAYQRKHKRAEEKNFDLKAAEALFSSDPKVREREKARRGKITEKEKEEKRAMSKRAWGVIILLVSVVLTIHFIHPL